MIGLQVVIISYNRRDLLVACIDSLLAHPSAGPMRITVVDNASIDGSVEAVRQRYAVLLAAESPIRIEIQANPTNRGFSAACNQALPGGTEPYVLLLNNDAEVTEGALDALIRCAEASERAGAVGCTILDARGKPGRLPMGALGRAYRRIRRGLVAEVEWIMGACVLLSRSALSSIGGLDEGFFFYYEDVDLGWRLRKAGFRCYVEPAARVRHLEGASSCSVRPFTRYHLYRGRVYLARKHFGPLWGAMTALWARLTLELELLQGREGIAEAAPAIRALLRGQDPGFPVP